MKGIVIQQFGPVTYTVEVDGKLVKRHVDHLWQQSKSASPPDSRTYHTIQDNFQYPEPCTESSEQVCRDEPSLEESLLQRYPCWERQPPDRLTLWSDCYVFKEGGNVVTVLYLLPCSSLRTVCYFLILVLYCIWCHSDVTHVHAFLYMACISGNTWLSTCIQLKFIVQQSLFEWSAQFVISQVCTVQGMHQDVCPSSCLDTNEEELFF